MAFPLVTFKHTNTDEGRHLEEVVTHKLITLEKYIGNETDTRCEVEFRKEAANQSGLIYRVEVNLWKAGDLFRAEALDESFEKAIDTARAELDAEMRKAHDKHLDQVRDGGRAAKEMLRGE